MVLLLLVSVLVLLCMYVKSIQHVLNICFFPPFLFCVPVVLDCAFAPTFSFLLSLQYRYRERRVRIAHRLDVECGDGLGDVRLRKG